MTVCDALVKENMLRLRTKEPETVAEVKVPASSKYQGFLFEKHSDLDELLVLDPIHDVDPEKGWPHAS